ncbi:c-type cytochrome [Dyella flagellata]|uniref:Cytochrome c n=1 Tax=Dyella flagellata TaxID=1867833 RepID=A0ABQ5X536_9GAMM|nr:c-type cytochrome [Dyella flagellata]GLQ86681.1 cytochrome c [Dyella flagellata]
MKSPQWILLTAVLALTACHRTEPQAALPAPHAPATSASAPKVAARFEPPAESSMPNDDFGKQIELGRLIFSDTGRYAKAYVGNALTCENCHLDAGRLAHSAPMWGAYPMYPAYRAKNHRVNTFAERLQGCFQYSMNGKAPPLGDDVLVALEAYAYWMSKGEPIGVAPPGHGYAKLPKPTQAPDYARGEAVFKRDCALCHSDNGQGQQVAGRTVFPPLWGAQSFNWGAGMERLDNAAGFIKANMPLGRGNTLTDQDAWDVAYFMDAHERPQDPRFKNSVAETRKAYHDTPYSLYGVAVNGKVLGEGSGHL